MVAKPGELVFRGAVSGEPGLQRMAFGDAAADQVEREKNKFLAVVRLRFERRLLRGIEIGGVDVPRWRRCSSGSSAHCPSQTPGRGLMRCHGIP